MNVKVFAVLTARDGRADELRSLLSDMVDRSRSEAGNLRYDLWEDSSHDGRFILDELYVDTDAATLHRNTDHFKHYSSVIEGLAVRLPISAKPIKVGEN